MRSEGVGATRSNRAEWLATPETRAEFIPPQLPLSMRDNVANM